MSRSCGGEPASVTVWSIAAAERPGEAIDRQAASALPYTELSPSLTEFDTRERTAIHRKTEFDTHLLTSKVR